MWTRCKRKFHLRFSVCTVKVCKRDHHFLPPFFPHFCFNFAFHTWITTFHFARSFFRFAASERMNDFLMRTKIASVLQLNGGGGGGDCTSPNASSFRIHSCARVFSPRASSFGFFFFMRNQSAHCIRFARKTVNRLQSAPNVIALKILEYVCGHTSFVVRRWRRWRRENKMFSFRFHYMIMWKWL